MLERCPTCNRMFYQKKGFNPKSLKNLNNGYNGDKTKKIIRVAKGRKCVMEGCKNKKFARSVLCLQHLSKREIQNDMSSLP